MWNLAILYRPRSIASDTATAGDRGRLGSSGWGDIGAGDGAAGESAAGVVERVSEN